MFSWSATEPGYRPLGLLLSNVVHPGRADLRTIFLLLEGGVIERWSYYDTKFDVIRSINSK